MYKLATSLLVTLIMALNFGTAHAAVKHVIIMIADGWGQSQIDAAAYWNGSRATYEIDPSWTRLGMTNYMYCMGWETPPYGGGGFVGIHGYDSGQAWIDWDYQQNFATDSGAAATAMSCGEKTFGGAIGVGFDRDSLERIPLVHSMERAEELGLATGLVTSVQLSHATPAGFRAHHENRNEYADIARELIYETGLDVLMGAGHPNYSNNGNWDPGHPSDPDDWQFVGGYETWLDLAAGTAAAPQPWTLVEEKATFEALADGSLVLDRVFGCVQVAHTLQYGRSGAPPYNDPEPPYADPHLSTVPSLATLTGGALQVLGQNPEGFMLMIEGGAIDWAGHGRRIGRLIEELDDFNAAVETVISWVETHSNWDETCLVVTGDHETGYLWGADVDPANPDTWYNPIQNNGPGNLPGFYFYSAPEDDWSNPTFTAGHSNQVIPFFARGVGTDRFLEYADEHDLELAYHRLTNPELAEYLDNTEIALTIFDLFAEDRSSEDEDPDEGEDGEVDGDDNRSEDYSTPAVFALHGNFPNPFNPTTNIAFSLPRSTKVTLRIHDMHGRLVRTLLDETRAAGYHEVIWYGLDDTGMPAASGVYFSRLVINDDVAVKKMNLVK